MRAAVECRRCPREHQARSYEEDTHRSPARRALKRRELRAVSKGRKNEGPLTLFALGNENPSTHPRCSPIQQHARLGAPRPLHGVAPDGLHSAAPRPAPLPLFIASGLAPCGPDVPLLRDVPNAYFGAQNVPLENV